MSKIILEDVTCTEDLLAALAAVAGVFSDVHAFDIGEHTFSKGAIDLDQPYEPKHRGELDPNEVERVDVPQGRHRAADNDAARRYVACPRRGEHLWLVECWLCWSDVYRGSVTEAEVLAPGAWDLSLRRLTGSTDQSADDDLLE